MPTMTLFCLLFSPSLADHLLALSRLAYLISTHTLGATCVLEQQALTLASVSAQVAGVAGVPMAVLLRQRPSLPPSMWLEPVEALAALEQLESALQDYTRTLDGEGIWGRRLAQLEPSMLAVREGLARAAARSDLEALRAAAAAPPEALEDELEMRKTDPAPPPAPPASGEVRCG